MSYPIIAWILADDGRLCANGYPIHIELTGQNKAFRLCVEGRHPMECESLAFAKSEARIKAGELDEFTPKSPAA